MGYIDGRFCLCDSLLTTHNTQGYEKHLQSFVLNIMVNLIDSFKQFPLVKSFERPILPLALKPYAERFIDLPYE